MRVSTIIDNVLQLSRRDNTRQERLHARRLARGVLANEFAQTAAASRRARCSSPATGRSWRCASTPRTCTRCVWNLCDNAVKYGGDAVAPTPSSCAAGASRERGRPYLEVADRGRGIDPADADRIFEPFFTAGTAARASGSSSRASCARRNGAMLALRAAAGRRQRLSRDLRRSAALGMVARRDA